MFHDWNSFSRSLITGLLTFVIINRILSKLIRSKNDYEHWKRLNIGTSFVHSSLSSLVCIYCVLENPSMCTTGIISSFTPKAYAYICFEMGYFLFDAIDMLRKPSGYQTFEIVLHHIIILICFGSTVYLGRYIGYAVLSLFMEFNSVFLHIRQLLLLWNRSRREIIFRINLFFNMLTFFLFRFGVTIYMSTWLFNNISNVPFGLFVTGQTGLVLIAMLNISLLYRLVKSDFGSKKSN